LCCTQTLDNFYLDINCLIDLYKEHDSVYRIFSADIIITGIKTNMTPNPKKTIYNPTSPAVEQAAQLLLCLGKNMSNDMGVTAICNEIGIHKSKGYSILNALAKYDMIIKDEITKTYCLGPALLPLAKKAKEKLDITVIAKHHLQKLATSTNTSVLLGIISNDQFYIAGKYDGNAKLSVTVRQHQSLHITHGAHGKAIFPFLSPTDQQRLLKSNILLFHGDTQDFDKKKLEEEAQFCLDHGYAVDNGKITMGIKAISSPVFDHNNRVTAAIVLVGTFNEPQFEKLGTKIFTTSQIISKQCGADI